MKNTLIDIFKDKKAVLFDLDGTVIDSMWMWKDVDVTYLSKRNIEYPSSLPVEIEGKTYYETAVYFKERFNLPDTLEEIMDEYLSAVNKYTIQRHMQEPSVSSLEEERNKLVDKRNRALQDNGYKRNCDKCSRTFWLSH